MPTIVLEIATGDRRTLEARTGQSILQLVRASGFDGLDAECGGNCCCATCHVVVDAKSITRFEAPSIDEESLLDCLVDRRSGSRLACQLKIGPHTDGAFVAIPAALALPDEGTGG